MEDCYDFSAEEALYKIESSLKGVLCVIVSYGASRGFLLGFFNAAVKYLAGVVIMSVAVAVGMKIFGETKKQFVQCKLNWWQESKFDGNNNFQYWGLCTIQGGHVDTMSRYPRDFHEEEL